MDGGSVLSLTAEDEQAYRMVLRHPGETAAGLGELLDWPAPRLAGVLKTLIGLGLVRREQDGTVAAWPPDAVLETMLDRELERVNARRQEIYTARSSVASFVADHIAGQGVLVPAITLEVVAASGFEQALEDQTRATRGEILVMRLSPRPVPGRFRALDQLTDRFLREGRGFRAIFSPSAMDDESLERIRRWVRLGARIRLSEAAPQQFSVFGDQSALVSSTWGQVGPASLLVQAPTLVAAHRALFDLVWERAFPLPPEEPSWTDEDRSRVLHLLAVGAKDETIARHLGVSLRTQRRRVAELMEELGAATRFQAGAEARRRGLI